MKSHPLRKAIIHLMMTMSSKRNTSKIRNICLIQTYTTGIVIFVVGYAEERIKTHTLSPLFVSNVFGDTYITKCFIK